MWMDDGVVEAPRAKMQGKAVFDLCQSMCGRHIEATQPNPTKHHPPLLRLLEFSPKSKSRLKRAALLSRRVTSVSQTITTYVVVDLVTRPLEQNAQQQC
jgi:hypothetical protein